jgi:hypothetical protein
MPSHLTITDVQRGVNAHPDPGPERHVLAENGGNWRFSIGDCRLLIDGGGCCNTSCSIGNQAAAEGQSPTNRQSAMETWSLVAAYGRAVALVFISFSRREDFSCCAQCLRVPCGQKSSNTEVTERLSVLRVKA